MPHLKTGAEFQPVKTARVVSGYRKVNAVTSTPGLECKSPGPSSAVRRPTGKQGTRVAVRRMPDPPQPRLPGRLGLEEAAREAGRRLPGLREARRMRLPGLEVAARGLPGLKEAARR